MLSADIFISPVIVRASPEILGNYLQILQYWKSLRAVVNRQEFRVGIHFISHGDRNDFIDQWNRHHPGWDEGTVCPDLP